MTTVHSLKQLLTGELQELFSSELQQVELFSDVIDEPLSRELKGLLAVHVDQSIDHLNRIELICRKLKLQPRGLKSRTMETLLERCREWLADDQVYGVREAGLIDLIQKVEHYEIAGYGTAQAHAALLGLSEEERLLGTNLEEEKEFDWQLSQLAESLINPEAREAMA